MQRATRARTERCRSTSTARTGFRPGGFLTLACPLTSLGHDDCSLSTLSGSPPAHLPRLARLSGSAPAAVPLPCPIRTGSASATCCHHRSGTGRLLRRIRAPLPRDPTSSPRDQRQHLRAQRLCRREEYDHRPAGRQWARGAGRFHLRQGTLELSFSLFSRTLSACTQANKNLWKAAQTFNLTLQNGHGGGSVEDSGVAIYDGESFVYQEAKGSWWSWNMIKLLWKYGRAPLKLHSLVGQTVATFTSRACPPSCFDSD